MRRAIPLQAGLVVALVLCVAEVPRGLVAAAPQAGASLADSLKRANRGETELHIFYVHGMGIDTSKRNAGTQTFEVSQPFRKNLCKLIGCASDEFEGRSYANEGDFAPDATPPPLLYFGEDIWKRGSDDWRAAAPFVDHYKLVLAGGSAIYVHEINWWPLVFAAKCRQIVAREAALVDLDKKHFATCAAKTVEDSNQKRFRSYAWITGNDVQQRQAPWPKPAVLNRSLKQNILDWGFADALLAVGPMQEYLVEGIRELVLASVTGAERQEFVVVSHSLGSYLMFAALDVQSDPQQGAIPQRENRFDKVLSQTSHAYFMANQVRLLELADLDNTKNGSPVAHLEHWSRLRAQAHLDPPRIVAWSDPGDLLTWRLPDTEPSRGTGTDVMNRPAQNATRWLWLLENPEKAHVNYEENKRVIDAMIKEPKAVETKNAKGD